MTPIDLLRDDLLRLSERAPDATPAPAPPARSVELGPCRMCHERSATARCLNCDEPVCKEHHWVMLGLCKGCATPDELSAAREGANRPRPDLGIKWIED